MAEQENSNYEPETMPEGLTRCEICNNVIAKTARACPHCGADRRGWDYGAVFSRALSIVLWLIIAAMMLDGSLFVPRDRSFVMLVVWLYIGCVIPAGNARR